MLQTLIFLFGMRPFKTVEASDGTLEQKISIAGFLIFLANLFVAVEHPFIFFNKCGTCLKQECTFMNAMVKFAETGMALYFLLKMFQLSYNSVWYTLYQKISDTCFKEIKSDFSELRKYFACAIITLIVLDPLLEILQGNSNVVLPDSEERNSTCKSPTLFSQTISTIDRIYFSIFQFAVEILPQLLILFIAIQIEKIISYMKEKSITLTTFIGKIIGTASFFKKWFHSFSWRIIIITIVKMVLAVVKIFLISYDSFFSFLFAGGYLFQIIMYMAWLWAFVTQFVVLEEFFLDDEGVSGEVRYAQLPIDYLEYQSNCYFFNSAETGFAAAEIFCTQLNGHLASVHDAFTNVMLGEEAKYNFSTSTETDFWIGANNLISNGKWNWTDGTGFDFNDWNRGEPNNTSGSNCAALSLTDGYWTAQNCFKAKPFVCQVPSNIFMPSTTTPSYPISSNCTIGWYYIASAQACYGANGDTHLIDWTSAEDYCESVGAKLPSIHSIAEFQYLESLIYTFWKDLWTGIYSINGGKTWNNVDGTPADFLNYGSWCSGHPFTNISGERCVRIVAACYFDTDCTNNYDTICKKSL